jgi:hypothetical protein
VEADSSRKRRSQIVALVLILVGFISGFALSPGIRGVTLTIFGPPAHRCFLGVCPGDTEAAAVSKLRAFPPEAGGIHSVSCVEDQGVQIRFFPDFVQRPCGNGFQSIEISDGRIRVFIQFVEGRVSRVIYSSVQSMDL